MAVTSCVWLLCASLIFITAVAIENGAIFRVRSILNWQLRAIEAIVDFDTHHQLKLHDSQGYIGRSLHQIKLGGPETHIKI
ncbi:hypothetical protein Hanom_Chr01g00053531 [Helianthus anomalus]